MKSQPVKILLILIIFSLLNINTVEDVFSSSIVLPGHQDSYDEAVQAGIEYISTQINDDGGIRWADENSNVSASLRVVIALAANGFPQDHIVATSGNRPIDFLIENGVEWVYQQDPEDSTFSTARAGQLLTAIAAANENPQSFGNSSTDLIYELNLSYDSATGIFGDASPGNVLDQVWAMLGLAANHFGIPEEAPLWLAAAQLDDGSWDDGFGSFLDTTPLALMALVSSGWDIQSSEIQSAIQYLKENQQDTAGWQTQWDSTTNPDTTGMILQSLSAIGLDYDPQWQNGENNPQTALIDIQQENGSFGTDYANAYSTADALIGLSGQPLFQLGMLKRVSDGFDYLISQQAQNGGWGTPGQTIDTMLAFTASGWDPNTIMPGDKKPGEYLIVNSEEYLNSGPDAVGKTLIASVIAGLDPMEFGGIDLIEMLQDTYNLEKRAFGDPQNTWHQSFALLGLYAAQQEIPDGILDTLLELQQVNGGWAYSTGFETTPDTTALVVQSLLAGGLPKDDLSIQDAISYLRNTQSDDGGWGDSSTTSFVLMAINTLGQSIDEWAVENGKNPVHALFFYQNLNGAFYFNADYQEDSLMSTATALIALAGRSYLIEPYSQKSENLSAVLVLPEESTTHAVCASFTEPSISGLELLNLSGVPYESQEGFMNTILDTGNPKGGTLYWSYWHWNGREWVFNTSGAGDSKVLPGSIEAWYLTSWEQFPSPPPRVIPDLDEICGTEVLKNFSVLPYLNYYDLGILQQIKSLASEPSFSETLVSTEQTLPSPSVTAVNPAITEEANSVNLDQQSNHSLVPLLIIAIVGITLSVVIVLILKKQK